MKYSKGTGAVSAKYARGGEVLNESRSRFMKVPDTFRTDTQKRDFDKTGKTGELSKAEGDSKSETPVKPRT